MKTIEMNRRQIISTYSNMFNRCYNDNVHKIKPWYADCTICPEWYTDISADNPDYIGRQVFGDWVNDGNFYVIDGEPTVELDHDILVKGNTVYGPDTCVFVPKSVNATFGGMTKKRKKYDLDLPVGVSRAPDGKYRCNLQLVQKELFSTPEEAWQAYAEIQKSKLLALADKYYGKVPQKLIDAIVNYQFDIND